MGDLLSTAEVADRLGRSVATINRWASGGFIVPKLSFPGAKGARLFSLEEVERVESLLTDPEEAAG